MKIIPKPSITTITDSSFQIIFDIIPNKEKVLEITNLRAEFKDDNGALGCIFLDHEKKTETGTIKYENITALKPIILEVSVKNQTGAEGTYFLKVFFEFTTDTKPNQKIRYDIKFKIDIEIVNDKAKLKLLTNPIIVSTKIRTGIFLANLLLLIISYGLWAIFQSQNTAVHGQKNPPLFVWFPLLLGFFMLNVDQFKKIFSDIGTLKNFAKNIEFNIDKDTFSIFSSTLGVIITLVILSYFLVTGWGRYAPVTISNTDTTFKFHNIKKKKAVIEEKVYRKDLADIALFCTINGTRRKASKSIESEIDADNLLTKTFRTKIHYDTFYYQYSNENTKRKISFGNDTFSEFKKSVDKCERCEWRDNFLFITTANDAAIAKSIGDYIHNIDTLIKGMNREFLPAIKNRKDHNPIDGKYFTAKYNAEFKTFFIDKIDLFNSSHLDENPSLQGSHAESFFSRKLQTLFKDANNMTTAQLKDSALLFFILTHFITHPQNGMIAQKLSIGETIQISIFNLLKDQKEKKNANFPAFDFLLASLFVYHSNTNNGNTDNYMKEVKDWFGNRDEGSKDFILKRAEDISAYLKPIFSSI